VEDDKVKITIDGRGNKREFEVDTAFLVTLKKGDDLGVSIEALKIGDYQDSVSACLVEVLAEENNMLIRKLLSNLLKEESAGNLTKDGREMVEKIKSLQQIINMPDEKEKLN